MLAALQLEAGSWYSGRQLAGKRRKAVSVARPPSPVPGSSVVRRPSPAVPSPSARRNGYGADAVEPRALRTISRTSFSSDATSNTTPSLIVYFTPPR